jgi:hypothetical protein
MDYRGPSRPQGKEIDMRTMLMIAVLAVFGTALLGGCRAEGEVGDVSSPVVAPR